jgi:predicted TIM-barrel fold metal-dependent hydrolase
MALRYASSRSAELRQQLGHPVIDADGHYVDLRHPFSDFVRDHGAGHLLGDTSPFINVAPGDPSRMWHELSIADRHRWRQPATPFWVAPGETGYWATVTMPSLYHERLGEAGIDFAVVYPTQAFGLHNVIDDERRVTLCRLFNEYLAEQYGPFSDRLTPAAVVPMHTPGEAVAELDHASGLGLMVANIPSYVWRPIPGFADAPAEFASRLRWIDTFGIDSEHDYDPVWTKAVELGIPLACHSVAMGFTDRASTSNYMYNHLGHFAAAGEAVAKSLFFGGVTRRFPELRVALLEGGVAVGVRIYADLVARWQKRGRPVLGRLNPANIDTVELGALIAKHGDRWMAAHRPEELVLSLGHPGELARDDFAASGVESAEDIRDQFCRSFYWGCEADDPLVGTAFDTRLTPLGATVPAVMGSDLGHWDVPEFSEPLEEAYELVERGILDADQFRQFVFDNQVRLYAGSNPRFFEGTTVERAARLVLAGGT